MDDGRTMMVSRTDLIKPDILHYSEFYGRGLQGIYCRSTMLDVGPKDMLMLIELTIDLKDFPKFN